MLRAQTLGAHWTRLSAVGWLTGMLLLLSACVSQQSREPVDVPPDEPTTQETPPPPCPVESARELERDAIELLDRGQTDEARHLLDCALRDNPDSRRATLLIRQLEADPVALLGARHYMYTVRARETLSQIAQDRLGDGLQFVILARYNDIPVPANLAAGQRIKIPGKRPAAEPRSVDTPPDEPAEPETPVSEPAAQPEGGTGGYAAALALEQQGDLEGAYAALVELRAQGSDVAGLEEDLARLRGALVADLEDKAYGFELSGDIDQAVATWQHLLEIDPRNIPAQLSIRRLTQ